MLPNFRCQVLVGAKKTFHLALVLSTAKTREIEAETMSVAEDVAWLEVTVNDSPVG